MSSGATMEEVSGLTGADGGLDMPPGFRFHPTDEEIITNYLTEKVVNPSFSARAIGEADFNKIEPWDLPSKAKMGEKEWYFFFQRDKKYPTGTRTNRATEAGYWKATGKDKEISKGRGCLVGMKKTLVFYKGRAPKGEKTNWVMHEYRLEGKSAFYNLPKPAKEEWVVCRVFHKNTGLVKKSPMSEMLATSSFGMNSYGDDFLDSPPMPPLLDAPYFNSSRPSSSFLSDSDGGGDFKGVVSTTSPVSYFSAMGLEAPQGYHHHLNSLILPTNYTNTAHRVNPSQDPISYSQVFQDSPYFSLPESGNQEYLHQGRNSSVFVSSDGTISTALRKHCKAEQYSNQSFVSASQDTGLSTDRNTEISSVVSKHNMGNYDDHEDHPSSSAERVVDLENLWKY